MRKQGAAELPKVVAPIPDVIPRADGIHSASGFETQGSGSFQSSLPPRRPAFRLTPGDRANLLTRCGANSWNEHSRNMTTLRDRQAPTSTSTHDVERRPRIARTDHVGEFVEGRIRVKAKKVAERATAGANTTAAPGTRQGWGTIPRATGGDALRALWGLGLLALEGGDAYDRARGDKLGRRAFPTPVSFGTLRSRWGVLWSD